MAKLDTITNNDRKSVKRSKKTASGQNVYVLRDEKTGRLTEVRSRPKSTAVIEKIISKHGDLLDRLAKR